MDEAQLLAIIQQATASAVTAAMQAVQVQTQASTSNASRYANALKAETINFPELMRYIKDNKKSAKHLTQRDLHEIEFLEAIYVDFDRMSDPVKVAVKRQALTLYYVVAQGWSQATQAMTIAKTEAIGLPPLMPFTNSSKPAYKSAGASSSSDQPSTNRGSNGRRNRRRGKPKAKGSDAK